MITEYTKDYTEADYRRMHQTYVEDLIDMLITRWHHDKCPLTARVCRNLATQLEDLREKHPDNLNVWVSAANEEKKNKVTAPSWLQSTNKKA